MNKFDRVFSTLILLQTKKLVKATEIATKYNVSLRTVYRDVNTLKTAGVPIIGDPGVGYSIMEGYRLPPLMFSEEEVAALLTAEKFVGKVIDKKTKKYYSDALLKIKSILGGSKQHALETLDRSILLSESYDAGEIFFYTPQEK